MSAPFAYLKGTFVNSDGSPKNGATILFRPLNTPQSLSGDVVTSSDIAVTLNSSGQFGFAGTTKFITGYYRVVVTDSDVFTVLVPNDGLLHDIEDLAQDVAGVSSAFTQNSLDAARLAMTLQGSTTVEVGRVGDRNSTNQRFLLIGDSTSLYVGGCKQLLLNCGANEAIGFQMNPGGNSSTLEINIAQTFGPFIADYSGPGGTGPTGGFQYFHYALGQEDLMGGAQLTTVKTFFKITGANYHVRVSGEVTFFMLSTGSGEPGGTTFGSTQGLWFQAQVAAATTRYKVVVMADAPSMGVTGYSRPDLNWPFKSLGIDLIIAGGGPCTEYRTHGQVPLLIASGMRDTLAAPDLADAIHSQYQTHTFWTLDVNEHGLSLTEFYAGNMGGVGADWPAGYAATNTTVKAAPHHLYIVASGSEATRVLTSASNGSINNNTFFPGITNFVVGDRILVYTLYNSTVGFITHAYSGIYTVTNLGSAGTPFVLTRAADMDTAAECNNAIVDVAAGGHYSSGGKFRQVNNITTLGTTSHIWEQVRLSTTAIVTTVAPVRMVISNELIQNQSDSAFYNHTTGVLTNGPVGSVNSAPFGASQGITDLVVGDRVLITGPCPSTAGLEHAFPGVYTITNLGSAGAACQFTRATDCNTDAELTNAIVYVQGGRFANTYFKQVQTPSLSTRAVLRWDQLVAGASTFNFSDPDLYPGHVLYSTEVVGPLTKTVSLAVKLAKHGGLTSDAEGVRLGFGSSEVEVQDGTTSHIGTKQGKIIRLTAAPTVTEIRAKGWWRDSLFLVGRNPTSLHCYDEGSSTVMQLAATASSSNNTKLAAPTLDPLPGASLYSVVVTLADSLAKLMVSVNGGDFAEKSDWPANRIITLSGVNPSWIAVYATRTGYADSDIVVHQCRY